MQLHQQKGMISLSPPTICNSAQPPARGWNRTRSLSFSALCLPALIFGI
ncbi:hypothetical protein EC23916_A0229 [Escherichia coli 2.3916]|nr:hypothetical protein EC23916_A0229 [Escherichia coli 2.3916]